MTEPGAVPAHVPPEMVYDFDLFGGADSPLFSDNLHGNIARLAEEGRDILFTPRNGGQWVIIGRDATFEAATDSDLFSSDPLIREPESTRQPILPIELDPPRHAPYRKIFSEIFSAAAMSKYEPQIREMATELIDKVIDAGRCDYAPDIAEPLPVLFFMRMMGFPLDRFEEFRRWVLTAISSADPAERDAIWGKVVGMSTELIHAREKEPRDDLISRLLEVEIDGRKPTLSEMQSFCIMLFVAGLDTVTNAMSLTMRGIGIDPELQQDLRANPKKIPLAIEELMRRFSGNTVQRFVRRDGEFRGAPLKKGDYVLIFYPAANLDPRAFPDPETVNIDRRASHLAFGAGIHRCVGAQLARVELRVLTEEWLRRIPTFTLDPGRAWKYHTGYVISIDSLPLVWDPAAVRSVAA
ncbi:MAG: cytochrome P450 [Sphingomonadales bacterium]|nr:MAG: cytochrome P450 [Sphingomonadales bacterium]